LDFAHDFGALRSHIEQHAHALPALDKGPGFFLAHWFPPVQIDLHVRMAQPAELNAVWQCSLSWLFIIAMK
jgi:hypothetical protein